MSFTVGNIVAGNQLDRMAAGAHKVQMLRGFSTIYRRMKFKR